MVPTGCRTLEKYFETKQKLTAANSAADFGFDYYTCATRDALKDILPGFLSRQGGPKILEIITDNMANQLVWNNFNKHIKERGS